MTFQFDGNFFLQKYIANEKVMALYCTDILRLPVYININNAFLFLF